MKVLVTGSSGFIGNALVRYLQRQGHTVCRLVRRPAKLQEEYEWEPKGGLIDQRSLEGTEVIIHLAGESIAKGRWTEQKKKKILESRRVGTELLCQTILSVENKPTLVCSASATGFYGSAGDEELTERSSQGDSFLSQVVRAWEAPLEELQQNGIRTVSLRLGMVLGKDGGALEKMLPSFRLGFGGPLGDGFQYWSWISLVDVLGLVEWLMTNNLSGAINAVSPNPVTNREFTQILCKILPRPALFPIPPNLLRLIMGELADELLLASRRVVPSRLLEAGFKFKHPTLEEALVDILKK